MIKKLSLLFLILIIVGCKNTASFDVQTRKSSDGFTTVKTIKFTDDLVTVVKKLEAKPLDLAEHVVFPMSVMYNDPYLIISDLNADSLIHVVNASDKKYVKSLGVKGFGPNEIMTASKALSLNSSNPGYVWSYDLQQRRFSKFDLSKNNVSGLAEKQYTFREGDFTSFRVGWSNRSTLIGLTVDGLSRFTEYDTLGNELKRYGDYDEPLSQKYPKGVWAQFYQGLLRANSENTLFAHSSIYIDQLELLNIDDNEIIEIVGPLDIEPRFEVARVQGSNVLAIDPKETHHGYMDVYVGEQFVYGLFSGKKWDGNPNGKELCNEIYVFNKEGYVVEKLVLDQLIRSITVDEKNGYIYGVSASELPDIVQFEYKYGDA
ncbi:BF3164 family lipoprotein [Roseivirga sp. E12]|uniref:BF3164 family lipoprotein n=1 Tax=Roseivirga sp. E12 TaxID=2819237 RepID=UPI001ABC3F95|nr:BF3164 family lipoprotein [Roseivirga sp. E12]MBO3700405.1 hypothetical protein [Roseivirga sp. E12]